MIKIEIPNGIKIIATLYYVIAIRDIKKDEEIGVGYAISNYQRISRKSIGNMFLHGRRGF